MTDTLISHSFIHTHENITHNFISFLSFFVFVHIFLLITDSAHTVFLNKLLFELFLSDLFFNCLKHRQLTKIYYYFYRSIELKLLLNILCCWFFLCILWQLWFHRKLINSVCCVYRNLNMLFSVSFYIQFKLIYRYTFLILVKTLICCFILRL